MATVELDDKEWQQVVAVLSNGPWNVVNPILTKLAQQLQHGGNSELVRPPLRSQEPKAKANS